MYIQGQMGKNVFAYIICRSEKDMDSMNLIPYIEDEKLFDYAVSCAQTLRPDGRGDGRGDAQALKRCFQEIRRCHSLLRRRYEGVGQIPAACEWLLDNFYLIQREYPGTRCALRKAERQRCRRGKLLITELCRALLHAGQGRLSEARCSLFLRGFQTVTVLQRRELKLFPAALRAVILEALAGACRKLGASSEPEELTELLAALFQSLMLLAAMDMEAVLDGADVPGQILAQEAEGSFPRMDRQTREDYLRRLSAMAEEEGLDEQALAVRLTDTARAEGKHVGFLLYPPRGELGSAAYIAALTGLTLFGCLIAFTLFPDLSAVLLLIVPLWSLVKGFVDFLLLRFIRPQPLPRLDLTDGVPPEGRTICVLSVLLGCVDPGRLEELRLASIHEGRELRFGLLADLPAAGTETAPGDEALILEARRRVEALNAKYGGGFYLFLRPRSFDGEGYSGHERKRGALTELAKLLCGQKSALEVTGDSDALRGTRYIISLDADTRIFPGSLGKLIGAALHPLNTPLPGPEGLPVSGHAVIHPRIETELESAGETDFALIFAGPGGSDPYGGLSTELYMDAFGSGGFAGKGILDAGMLLRCGEKLPEKRVLSHDALEGAYLRGAYMSDAAFSDAFPAKPLAYFKRMQRWVRGDWQNAPWIFKREVPVMDRFRLLDSLRRSLLAPLTLTAMLLGLASASPGLRLAGWAALLTLLQDLLLTLAEAGLRREDGRVRLRRHTRLLTGLGGAIVRNFMRLWLLPFEAWVCLTAMLTALWRMLVSHRRLLQWTTFAEFRGSTSLGEHVKAMWPCVVLGVLLMAFAPQAPGKAAGLMWLLTPAATAALALPSEREAPLSVRDSDLLHRSLLESWGYYKELCCAEDHFLPPDNFQQQPPVGTAHRTSPTNIGLALASAAALGTAGVIPRAEAVAFLGRMLPTLEGMEKHRGHFFNWYDTRSLRPLRPRFVSTVDSGNLCAGLITACAALRRWGEYALEARLRSLWEEMDFAPLYDARRELFYICYDAEKERGAGGWYDLMASEAMLTSYMALARGQVPLRHWRQLSRAQLQKDGFRGLASWTGTMFEYLMPMLFLPLYRSSLLYESARFCLYVQRRRHLPGKPWGISESAFYSLDASNSYRYKAHGCPALALKRGQEEDLVIAPYASFLALMVEPGAAARNLRRLRELGAVGRWGYMEALDFTPGRCTRRDGEKVRCWMAHHVGMSILAALNTVDKGLVRSLFMNEPEMAAFTLLLQEKLPDSAAVICRELAPVPERPEKSPRRAWEQSGSAGEKPRACLLSNGAYSLRLKDSGESAAFLGDLCVYRSEGNDPGLSLQLGERTLLPAAVPCRWEFGEEHCRWEQQAEGVSWALTRQSAEGELGEALQVSVLSAETKTLSLALRFAPILAAERDWESHRAYWQLGMSGDTRDNCLLLHRLSKHGEAERWLCLAADAPAVFDADARGGLGALLSPLVSARVTLSVTANRKTFVRFALALGRSADEAIGAAARILAAPSDAAGNMTRAAALRLGMSGEELGEAMDLVLPLWENRLMNAAPKSALWRWGISGDVPLICCEAGAAESERLLRAFCLLKSCGLEAELVYLSDEHGEYLRPRMRELERRLASFGLEALFGVRGGVLSAPTEAGETLHNRAAVFVGRQKLLPPPLLPALPAPRRGREIPAHGWDGERFSYTVEKSLPPRIWQHVITNGSLSAFAADFGPAGLWLRNAREMRLLPPPDDIRDTTGTEALYAWTPGGAVSLFADGQSPCAVAYSPAVSVWRKEIAGQQVETALFIPMGLDLRILLIRGAGGLTLGWELHPRLGTEDASGLQVQEGSGLLRLTDAGSWLTGTALFVAASVPLRVEKDFCPAALRLTLEAEDTTLLLLGTEEESVNRALFPGQAEAMLRETQRRWRQLLGRFQLERADMALMHFMNTWAVYQSYACRLLARSSLYQSGGAIGFRDQLQDSVNLLLIDPGLCREQILDCCRHQYREGDVMHWWHRHPNGDRGVRTRCSDDLLWLPWALCEYTEGTGDLDLCARELSFVRSPELREEERDRYETPERTEERATVLEHAFLAIELARTRGFGPHGLPWMGSGDWNDGLDRTGGESVWLGWFFSCCTLRFAELLEKLDDKRAAHCRELSEQLGRAADAAFNGRWYLRAWRGDGRPLGDGERIDSLSQSWAAFCPWASPEKVELALESALERLVDREHGIIRLLAPPYTALDSPGYLSGYGEGFRENGGQYTHAAIWLALACLRRGQEREGRELMHMLLPETRDLKRYEAEPFVLPADVCAAPGHEGTAGWTWYTGSAGWYFRAVCEGLLGLRLLDGKLHVSPAAAQRGDTAIRWTDAKGKEHRIEAKGGTLYVDGRQYDGEGI